MKKLIYKSEKPYSEDINDLIEEDYIDYEDEEIEKGRGPDKKKRKPRTSYSTKTGGNAKISQHSSGRGYSVHYEGTETAGHYRNISHAQADAKRMTGYKEKKKS